MQNLLGIAKESFTPILDFLKDSGESPEAIRVLEGQGSDRPVSDSVKADLLRLIGEVAEASGVNKDGLVATFTKNLVGRGFSQMAASFGFSKDPDPAAPPKDEGPVVDPTVEIDERPNRVSSSDGVQGATIVDHPTPAGPAAPSTPAAPGPVATPAPTPVLDPETFRESTSNTSGFVPRKAETIVAAPSSDVPVPDSSAEHGDLGAGELRPEFMIAGTDLLNQTADEIATTAFEWNTYDVEDDGIDSAGNPLYKGYLQSQGIRFNKPDINDWSENFQFQVLGIDTDLPRGYQTKFFGQTSNSDVIKRRKSVFTIPSGDVKKAMVTFQPVVADDPDDRLDISGVFDTLGDTSKRGKVQYRNAFDKAGIEGNPFDSFSNEIFQSEAKMARSTLFVSQA